jgi:hypothetical protein
MRSWILGLGVLWMLVATAGCAELELGCDDLGDMLGGPGGLTVTEEEHPTGWGHERCFGCHSVERMHVQNCTGVDEVDLAEIRTLVDAEGIGSCSQCHGDNGVLR